MANREVNLCRGKAASLGSDTAMFERAV